MRRPIFNGGGFNFISKIKNKPILLDAIYILLICLAVFVTTYFFQFNSQTSYFTGEDSFYHVGMAKFLMQNGLIVHHFPYLNFTILNEKFVDWHFLFHVLLIPFIKIFGEINGPKIMAMTILAATFSFIYLIFKEKNFKLAFVFALILFFIMPAGFYVRLSFIRAPILSLFFIVLSIYLMIKNRPFFLAIAMFLFVWSYYLASVLSLFLIGAYVLAQIFNKEKINFKLLTWALIGFLAGFIINPFFPKNFSFFFVQSSVIFTDKFYVGMELFPPSAWAWFYSSIMAVSLFLGGIIIAFLKNIKQDSKNMAIFILAMAVLILQWKSSRFIEYWPILGGLTGLLLAGNYIEDILLNLKKNWRQAESWIVILVVLAFIQGSMIHGAYAFMDTLKNVGTTTKIQDYKEVSQYLKDNSQKGDIVFNKWDDFSYLFYFNQKNYYVVGLDPVFLKKYNQDLFDKYIDLFFNPQSETNSKIIKTDFKARWVLVSESRKYLKEKLLKDPQNFQKVYENSQFTIFKNLEVIDIQF